MTENGTRARPEPAALPTSRVTFWRAGFTLAAFVAASLTGAGAWLYLDEVKRVEDHNRAAEALGILRCVARLVDRYRETEGRLPQGSFAGVLEAVAVHSRPKGDLLYHSLAGGDALFSHYFTHARVRGGVCAETAIGAYRHEVVGLIDPFGKPYQYLRDAPSGYTAGLALQLRRRGYVLNTPGSTPCAYVLVSNGLDRRLGTEDDIRVTSETPHDIKDLVPVLGRPFAD